MMALTTPARVRTFVAKGADVAAEQANTFLATLPHGLAIQVQATELQVDGEPWYTLCVTYELIDPTVPEEVED